MERELDEELRFHLEQTEARNLRAGMPPAAGAGVELRDAVAAGRSGSAGGWGGGGTGAGSRGRLRGALVTVEVTLAVVVLVGAGLLGASFQRLQRVDLGFEGERVLAVPLALTGARYDEDGARARFVAAALDRLAALPGVGAVSETSILPLDGGATGQEITIEGRAPAARAAAIDPARVLRSE